MKRTLLVVFLILSCMAFGGCGTTENSGKISETTLIIGRKDTVTNVIVEPFDKDYYSKDALETFFKETISDFSVKNHDGSVTLSDIAVENQVAKATLEFDSADTYSKFYNNNFFIGTLNDAYDKGYNLDVTLKAVDGSGTIGKLELMEMKDGKILITDEQLCIRTESKILYTSANVEVIDKKYVRISSDSSGNAYLILYK